LNFCPSLSKAKASLSKPSCVYNCVLVSRYPLLTAPSSRPQLGLASRPASTRMSQSSGPTSRRRLRFWTRLKAVYFTSFKTTSSLSVLRPGRQLNYWATLLDPRRPRRFPFIILLWPPRASPRASWGKSQQPMPYLKSPGVMTYHTLQQRP
jgi:hypothetical protein